MAEEQAPKVGVPGTSVVELRPVAPLTGEEILQLRIAALTEALEASRGSAAIWKEVAQGLQREAIPDLQKALGAAYAQIRDLVGAVGNLINQMQPGEQQAPMDPQQLLGMLNQLRMASQAKRAQRQAQQAQQQQAPQGQGGGGNGR